MKNKKVLAIGLIVAALVFLGSLIYLSMRLSQPAPIAPTAPVSEPRAAENYGTDPRCAAQFTVTEACTLVAPVWSDWSICSAACGGGTQTRTCTPGSCGGAASCDAIDGGLSTRACNTAACESNVSIDKKAYQNDPANTPGDYALSTEINTVSKNQLFVYTIIIKNNTDTTASGVVVKDPLTGENQDQISFTDTENVCGYTASTKTLTCNTTLDPNQTKRFSFRATVLDTAVNGMVIKNIATVTHDGNEQQAEKDLLISTVVSCNNTCTTDSECDGGLSCDTSTNKCRNSACLETDSCICSTPTPELSATPTGIVTPQPTVLPESGIFNLPGVAAFGGGLLLAIIGILLAL